MPAPELVHTATMAAQLGADQFTVPAGPKGTRVVAEVDFNLIMTGDGRFIEVQGTAEGHAFSGDELQALMVYYHHQLQRLEQHELSASEILDREPAANPLASLALVARVLMNLDETITKQ